MRTYYTLLILGIFAVTPLRAQESIPNSTWSTIEKALGEKNRVNDLGIRLEDLKKQAVKGEDDIAIARAFYYINILQDMKYEDTLYFYNSRYQDSIINAPAARPLLRTIMLHLKAKRITKFRIGPGGTQRAALYRSYTPGEDYGRMSEAELDSMAGKYFNLALQIAQKLPPQEIDRLTWIADDPYSLLFKPELSDLIYLQWTSSKIRYDVMKFNRSLDTSWLQRTPQQFINSPELFSGTENNYNNIFRAWILGKSQDSAACLFLDMQLRRAIYLDNADRYTKQYEQFLATKTLSSYTPVKASAIYQRCMLWTKDLSSYYYYYPGSGAPSQNLDLRKAIDLYRSHKATMDSFPVLNTALLNMQEEITAPSFMFTLKDQWLPYQASAAQLTYRNVDTLYLQLVKLPAGGYTTEKQVDSIRNISMVRDTMVVLGNSKDLRYHSAYIKLPPLAPGQYAWLVSDQQIRSVFSSRVKLIIQDINRISVVEMYNRMYVLDRETGSPLEGAQVVAHYSEIKKKLWTKKHRIGKEGWCPLDAEVLDNLMIYYKGDTLFTDRVEDFSDQYNYYDDRIFSKEDYDSKAEYFEDHLTMRIFTDRSIYRPGQKIFFKGVLFTNDPRTGREVILNWGNLKLPFYQKWLARMVKTFGNKKIELVLKDAFDRPVDTFRVWPNKYGSFIGSYTIPKNAATGEWEFDNDWFDIDFDGFKVEEYKKPTMTVSIEKPKKLLMPGDSIPFTVKTRSFAGADLDGVQVHVKVNTYGGSGLIMDTTLYSVKGKVQLFIVDTSALNKRKEEGLVRWMYDVNVSALDRQGELVEERQSITVSNRPALVKINLDHVTDAGTRNKFRASAATEFGETLEGNMEVTIFRENRDKKSFPVDTWLYPKEEILPLLDSEDGSRAPYDSLTTWTLRANEVDSLRLTQLKAGNYRFITRFFGKEGLMGEHTANISIFNSKTNEIPYDGFAYVPVNQVRAGAEIKMISGNGKDRFVIYALGSLTRGESEYQYQTRSEGKGLQQFSTKAPANMQGNMLLYRVYLDHGKLMLKEETLYGYKETVSNEIMVERYRQKLVPGTKEKVILRFSTSDGKRAAELMTVMYDASLDKLEPHAWNFNSGYYNGTPVSLRRSTDNSGAVQYGPLVRPINLGVVRPVWWTGNIQDHFASDIEQMLPGRIAGVSIVGDGGSNAMNEVVVTGYGSRRSLTGTVVTTIRGAASLSGADAPLVVVDGVIFQGDVNALQGMITDVVVLKDAQATAIYGSRAANGVVIVSTKGKVILPEPPPAPEQPAVIRKNFQETAFFYPRIHADRKGRFSFEFDVPENLTTWKWKMLAHTMDARYAYVEKDLVTQLPVMVQPAMPRFLYQGDKIILRSRISNLDTLPVKGTLRLKIEDLVTGEDVTAKFTANSSYAISVDSASNNTGQFSIAVPESQPNPVKIRVSYSTPTFSDGEENILPILTRKFLFTATQSAVLKPGINEVKPMALSSRMEFLGTGYAVEPQARATLLNALPSLVNYPWNCAEQTFNKIFGHAMARQYMVRDSMLGKSWSKAKFTQDAKELPVEIDANMMPWLVLNRKTSIQQAELYKLFDTIQTAQRIADLISFLEDMQLSSGGMPWFKGGDADNYITAYLVRSIGKMRKQGVGLGSAGNEKRMNLMLGKMIRYMDQQIAGRKNSLFSMVAARGYHLKDHAVDSVVRWVADSLVGSRLQGGSLGNEAELIIMRSQWYPKGSTGYNAAVDRLESLRQLSVQDDVNGLRWKELADDKDLAVSHEETVARLAEAFELAPFGKEVQDGVIKWLLTARRDHGWGSTKATAEVVGLLASRNGGGEAPVSIDVDGSTLGNDLFSGSGSVFIPGGQAPSLIQMRSTSHTRAGINYYYLSDTPPASSSDDLTLTRNLYRYDGRNWLLVDSTTELKLGDKLRVELEVFTKRQLQYVIIEDRRAAAFETQGMQSGYQWGQFGYYLSVRDASMQFFASRIPAGRSMIRYELVVSASGRFHNGHATLTCMYKPDKMAYSNTLRVSVKE